MNKKTLALLSLFLLLGISQSNCMAQGFLNKLKNKVAAVGGSSKESPSQGPAQPLSKAKNMVSEVRALTGISQEAFEAKMKAKGLKYNEQSGSYSSKSSPYQFTCSAGEREGQALVYSVSRSQAYQNATTARLKADYAAASKACADLEAAFENAIVSGQKTVKASKKKKEVYQEALEKAFGGQEPFSGKAPFGAGENYEEKDYSYSIALTYSPSFPQIPAMGSIVITVQDLTIESVR